MKMRVLLEAMVKDVECGCGAKFDMPAREIHKMTSRVCPENIANCACPVCGGTVFFKDQRILEDLNRRAEHLALQHKLDILNETNEGDK